MNTTDTIAAPASGTGGAVTIIRISGPRALAVAGEVWQGRASLSAPENCRKMLLGKIGNDPALAVYMRSPASYTGDDVVELQCHGGSAACKAALEAVLKTGCRLAEPGEFTFRAFVNGKVDLTQAEAVSDLVGSGSDAARRLAEAQLAGGLRDRIGDICDRVTALRSECEARLDFPDEELDFSDTVPEELLDIGRDIDGLLATEDIGNAMREGVTVVLAGAPNSGKSSLLNCLLGSDRAIVSDIPGTTRDIIEVPLSLRGFPVTLNDTAGLRESDDPLERNGVERSYNAIAGARAVFYLIDASLDDPSAEIAALAERQRRNFIAVWNKIDLVPGKELPDIAGLPTVRISAAAGENISALLDAFEYEIRRGEVGELPPVAVNARSAALLREARSGVSAAVACFADADYELAAAELASAGRALGLIVGRNADPDLLDEVFKNFCIGK